MRFKCNLMVVMVVFLECLSVQERKGVPRNKTIEPFPPISS